MENDNDENNNSRNNGADEENNNGDTGTVKQKIINKNKDKQEGGNNPSSSTTSSASTTTMSKTNPSQQKQKQKQQVKLHHTLTVCMVPPPAATEAWDALTKARTQVKDPGLYRWPPHANLLYPFVNAFQTKPQKTQKPKQQQQKPPPEDTAQVNDNDNKVSVYRDYDNNNDDDDDDDKDEKQQNYHHHHEEEEIIMDENVLEGLSRAAQQVEPFLVTLEARGLGTFGGKNRGVLWIYPNSTRIIVNTKSNGSSDDKDRSNNNNNNNNNTVIMEQSSPLIELQALLEREFPACTTQRTAGGGSFHPHMTLSHYPSLEDAKVGQQQIESWWPSSISCSNGIQFVCCEMYLLRRVGDGGQFKRLATIPLGQATTKQSIYVYHNNYNNKNGTSNDNGNDKGKDPAAFPAMPLVEEDWVRAARMKLKERRNRQPWKRRRKRGRGRKSVSPKGERKRTTDTPEEIAAKRAARKAKRERLLEAEAAQPAASAATTSE